MIFQDDVQYACACSSCASVCHSLCMSQPLPAALGEAATAGCERTSCRRAPSQSPLACARKALLGATDDCSQNLWVCQGIRIDCRRKQLPQLFAFMPCVAG